LALGYSVKSKGIAKDLYLPESSVVNSISLKSPNEMVGTFALFLPTTDRMRKHLQEVMPAYKEQLKEADKIFDTL